MNIGFIGIGQMGAGMVSSLLKGGHEVTVYNRTPAKAAPLVAQGAKLAAVISDACRGEAVFTMLSNDEAVQEVVLGEQGIIRTLHRDTIHISSSTISVTLSEQLTDAHKKAGQHFIAAPVFGRPEAAAGGKLFVIAGGEEAALKVVAPLLDVIGQRTFVVSESPKTASLVKLSGNFLIASVIESLGEAMALVSKAGVDRGQYIELLTSSLFNVPVYKTYGELIAAQKFKPPGFSAPLGKKDIRLLLEAADQLNVPLPLASLLRDRFLSLLALGDSDLDWSAISTLAAKDAGATGRKPPVA